MKKAMSPVQWDDAGRGRKDETGKLSVISYKLYGKDCTEYLGSSIKSTHSSKVTEQLITYN
jgi:hypothetical protein